MFEIEILGDGDKPAAGLGEGHDLEVHARLSRLSF
jgi:hypothetical protein